MSDLIGGRYKKIKYLSSNETAGYLTFLVEDEQIVLRRKYVAKIFADIEDQAQKERYDEILEIFSSEVFRTSTGISQLRDAGEDRYSRYLIFDYVEGDTLEQIIQHDKKLDSYKVEGLLNEILDVVKPIHEAGYVHGDIKPSNIVIRFHDKQVILIDWDATTKIDTNSKFMSQGRTVSFTSGYAPTEQQSGRISAQNDLYAIGMTAIKSLTGQNPRVVKRYSDGTIKLPSNFTVGYHLNKALTKLTHKSFTQRYFSCDEVFNDLVRTGPTEKIGFPLPKQDFSEENEKSNISVWSHKTKAIAIVSLTFFCVAIVPLSWAYITVTSWMNVSTSNPVIPSSEIESDIDDKDEAFEEFDQIRQEGLGRERKRTSDSETSLPIKKPSPHIDKGGTKNGELETIDTESDIDTKPKGELTLKSDKLNSRSLFRDARRKGNGIKDEKKINVPTDDVKVNADSVSENQNSGLFKDGRK